MSTASSASATPIATRANWTRMSILNTRPGRAVLLGSVDSGLLPRHLERCLSATRMTHDCRAGLHRSSRAPSLQARQRAARCHRVSPAASTSVCFRSTPRTIELLLFDRSPEPGAVTHHSARTRGATAPTTTGTRSCRASRLARSMRIGRTDHSRRERGLRFDAEKLLLDPYGLAVAVPGRLRPHGRDAGRARTRPVAMKSVVADPGRYDWEGDQPLRRPFAETMIYELHVRGFTRHPSVGRRGRQSAGPMPD